MFSWCGLFSRRKGFHIKTLSLSIHRCKVPECDVGENNREIIYDQTWLKDAIPTSENGFENCFRYAPNNSSTPNVHKCDRDQFDTNRQIQCTEFVYKTDETNVQTEVNGFYLNAEGETCWFGLKNSCYLDRVPFLGNMKLIIQLIEKRVSFFQFNIHCDDSYMLPLIGSANNVGRLLFLPLTGVLSDK